MSKGRIEQPYRLKKNERKVIATSFTGSHKEWGKDSFNDLKCSIRDYLRIQQENKCCYCKRNLGFDIKEVDIEHILPKATFQKFTFEPKNLALSCPGCNTSKGDDCVTNYQYKNYPRNGNKIKIVHAHFDSYYEHIEIIDGIIYAGKTRKGCETITMCKLFRLREVERNAKKHRCEENEIDHLVSLLNSAKDSEKKTKLENVLRSLVGL